MTNYGEKLKDPRWQKLRLEILSRDQFTCKLCGDKETTLHVHHMKYSGNPWDAQPEHLVTLCEDCHLFVTYGKGKSDAVICIDKFSTVAGGRVLFCSLEDYVCIFQIFTNGSLDSLRIDGDAFDTLLSILNKYPNAEEK